MPARTGRSASLTLPTGGPQASRSSRSRAPAGAPASRVASVPASDRCSADAAQRLDRVGRRRQAEVVQQLLEPLRRAAVERVRERRAEPGGVDAERVPRRAHEPQRARRPPDQARARAGSRAAPSPGAPNRRPTSAERRRLRQHREHLEHLQRRGVEPVDGALHAEPPGGGGGERRDVGRQRDGEVGTPCQQVGEGVVVPPAQVVGQAPRRGRPSGGCGVDHLPTVRGPAPGRPFPAGGPGKSDISTGERCGPWSSSIIGRVDLPRAPRS